MNRISVILPNGSKKLLHPSSTLMDLAKEISVGLSKCVVLALVNGKPTDLQDQILDKSNVTFVKAGEDQGIEVLRHSCEHLLAFSVCKLFPDVQVAMGPKKHNKEFYYDFDIGRPFTENDLEAIEKKIQELIDHKISFTKSLVSKKEALKIFANLNQRYKPEILEWIPDNEEISIYRCGDFVDLCRGPHVPNSGLIGAFKLLGVSGSYWRADSNREMLQRVKGICFANKKDLQTYLYNVEEAKKRDHRKIGPSLGLFFVSDKFGIHRQEEKKDVFVLIAGTIREDIKDFADGKINSLLGSGLLNKINEAFPEKKVRFSGCSISSHDTRYENLYDIVIKIFSSPISKEQRKKLAEIENIIGKDLHKSKLTLVVESQFNEEIGPGLVTWMPNGARIRSVIEDFFKKVHFKEGYEIVYTPHIAKSDLWKVSGHWDFYRENMFPPMNVDGQEYLVKPMNCPFHILIYKKQTKSYRDMPVRLAEIGTVYRYEMAGVLHGLMRARGFSQDDAHVFCRWDQLGQEVDKIIDLVLKMLSAFGFSKFEVHLSTKPEKHVGDLSKWSEAESVLQKALEKHKLPYIVDEGGGAFYGPKIDIALKDSLDRLWQCSTIQLDFNNPERFDLKFVNDKGEFEHPVMIHRAIFGSLERFFAILIEEYGGAFPAWLAPEQIRVLSIAERHFNYAKSVKEKLLQKGYRVNLSNTNEKLGAKIRQAQMDKVPIMLIVGDQEVEQESVSARLRTGENLGVMKLENFISYCQDTISEPVI